MRNALLSSMIAALGLVVLVGCSENDKGPKTVAAQGIVTLDGKPVGNASVVFIDSAGQYPARGYTDSSGKFSLDAFEYKTGAVPGSYKAMVTRTVVDDSAAPPANSEEAEHAAGEEGEAEGGGRVYNDLPAKYSNPSDELAFTIPEEGTSDLKLELTSN